MSKCTCVVLGDELSTYHFGEQHPFGPKRYWAFKEEFEKRGLDKLTQAISPKSITEEQLLLFHTPEHINKVKELSKTGKGYLDYGDTPARKNIYESACVVVGGVIKALDHIMTGKCSDAFSPIAGLHHASRSSAAGFCVFNDCGIAIEYLRYRYQLQRIAYIDIDAHHGDGVFYAFEDNKDICIVDFHQDGRTLYPGTGNINETGTGEAAGTKLNVPLPPNTGDEIALKLWQGVEGFIEKAQPEFIILHCGADSLSNDPITQLDLTAQFHAHVCKRLKLMARQHCQGRLLAVGGGGYNLNNIKVAWNNVVETLCHE